jgi:multiple sugar transport system substrate-binding protein
MAARRRFDGVVNDVDRKGRDMSAQHHRLPRIPRAIGLTAAAAAIALIAAGCSAPDTGSGDSRYGFPTVEQDADAPITVWVDADRAKIAEAFAADHPDITVNIETYDGNSGGTNSFQTKVALADAAGEGWPDVVWSGQVNDASWAAHEQNGVQAFAAPLNLGVTEDGWLDGYTPGALDPVTVDGNVYGARDNLAPVVFWYNKALFDEFGLDVPETWEDYQALSDQVAAEHPGYILGSIGDPFTAVLTNMWAAQAPIYTVDGDGNFTADFEDDHTTRMIDLMDHMFANGTLTLDGLFTPDWAANHKDTVLGIPGPTWFIGAVIQNPDSLAAAPGTWAAGAPLHWEGEDVGTGNVGGGFWYGSSHSANLEAVGEYLQYVTSGPKSVELITGLPAYESTASEWLDVQVESGYWANPDEFKDVVTGAASSIWPGWGATLSFSSEPAWAEIVAPALAAGQTIASVADEWKTRYENDAQVNGYTVK